MKAAILTIQLLFAGIIGASLALSIKIMAEPSRAETPVPKGALMGTMNGNRLYYFLDNENGNVIYTVTHGGRTMLTSQPMEKNDAPCTH